MFPIPNKTISQFIPRQLPETIRSNYPEFISFLTAYYEWLEQPGNLLNGIENLLSYRDVDLSLNQFITHFQDEFLVNIPVNVLTDKRKLVKHIKEFYRARGTLKSYQFLFRILFNEDVDLYFPGNDLMTASAGTWTVDKVMRISTNNDTFSYISHRITGLSSGATAYIENVIRFRIGENLVTELYLSNIQGTFQSMETVSINLPSGNFLEETYSLLIGVTIINPGLGYAPNDPIQIVGIGNGTGAFAAVDQTYGFDTGRVTGSTSTTITLQDFSGSAIAIIDSFTGQLENIQIINPGQGYLTPPDIIISGGGASVVATATSILDEKGKISLITIDTPGVGYSSVPDVLIGETPKPLNYYNKLKITITDGPGSGQTNTIIAYSPLNNQATVQDHWTTLPTNQSHYSIALGMIKTVKVKDFGIDYNFAPTVNFSKVGDGNATGIAQVGVVGTFPGKWVTTASFLNSNQIIQDSFKWQSFSYVVKVGVSLNLYKDVVLRLLHPSGTLMFGEVDIFNQITIGPNFGTFQRHRFYYPPYNRWGKPYYVNVGDADFQTNPETTYLSPNAGYWNPGSFGNTQLSSFSEEFLQDIIDTGGKYNLLGDSYIEMGYVQNSLPSSPDIVAEYNMVVGSNTQILYDVVGLHNGFLGQVPTVDFFDPSYNSVGVNFASNLIGPQYLSALGCPTNPLKQTIIVVARAENLLTKQSILGSIDCFRDGSVSGYAINLNVDGSLECRSQKSDGVSAYNLLTTSNSGLIEPGQWFMASLRYAHNTLTENIYSGIIVDNHSESYSISVDSGVILNNTFGYVIGNQGFVPPNVDSSYFQHVIWGNSFWGYNFLKNVSTPGPLFGSTGFPGGPFEGTPSTVAYVNIDTQYIGQFFQGDVAYAVVYNKELSDMELFQAYIYLQTLLAGRGITI